MRERTLQPIKGFSREIGLYLAGLEEVREQLRDSVAHLSVSDNARIAIPETHSIGALVLHIGEAEWWWMHCVVANHELTEADAAACFWDVLKEPHRVGEKGLSAQFCLEEISRIREQTRKLLTSFSDNDLDQIFSYARKEARTEVSLRWILHHLIDHEAQHKGQILMLKRLMGLQNDGLFA